MIISMEHKSLWKSNSYTDSQEIPQISVIHNSHFDVHDSLR
jgi:hypothetical protein